MESKYDESGTLKTMPTPDLKPGDAVRYTDTKQKSRHKLEKIWIHGIWDGEKAEFCDADWTIVRNKRWLTKM